jgi:hypothetical protein
MMMQGIAPKASQKPLQNHYTELEVLIDQGGLRSPKPQIQVRFLTGAPDTAILRMAGGWRDAGWPLHEGARLPRLLQ